MALTRKCESADLVKDNYFLYGYIVGEYSEVNCPRWLAKAHFNQLRSALKGGKMRLEAASLAQHLRAETSKEAAGQKAERYTIASLLDHMDWMPARIIDDEMTALLPRMTANGRIWWR